MFATTQRTLEADGFGGTTLGVLLVFVLLSAWGAWFLGAEVTLYAVSNSARIEISQAAHPVEAPVAGRVIASSLVLDREVHGGEVLVEIDAAAQQLQREEEQTRLRALAPQIEALHTTIAAEEQAMRVFRQAGRVALDETRARHREAETAARAAEEESELFARLQARNLPSQLDLLRAKAEVNKRRAAVDTMRLAVSRLESDHRTQESDRKARLEGLRRDVARLASDMTTAAATVERLAHEIERRRIRAPMAGRLGQVAELHIGSVVREGDRLAAVVPHGDLQVVADFLPPSALGRIRPGQPARLRLEGFPWMQYGSLAATVSRVASEVRSGRIRVELSVDSNGASSIPLQHGLPGTVEVQVERVTPAALVLRAAGKLLARPVAGETGRAEDGRVNAAPTPRRRLLVPEVVQTSAMDCGPAALTCLLEGFHISVSYGRLREACQTDVDGTSIDMLEEAAVQLGLEAEQMMLPVDHVLLPEAQALPAIAIVRLPSGVTHFVVAWRRHGRLLQLMDPGTGRRWPTCQHFLHELYVHTMPFPAAAWREWAGSEECLGALRRRLAQVGLSSRPMTGLIEAALMDPGWRPLAALDASTRMVAAVVRAGGLGRGQQAARVLERYVERAWDGPSGGEESIPADYWMVRPAPSGPGDEAQVLLRGAVLVRVRGRRAESASDDQCGGGVPWGTGSLSPELAAALEELPSRPGRDLLQLLRADGLLAPAALLTALLLAAGGLVVEALLFRSFFDLGRELGLAGQRLGAMGVLLGFVAALLLLELPLATGLLRLGRHLEARLRLAFLAKIPRLDDRYFRSRLTSDMAERCHTAHTVRLLPDLGGHLLRCSFELVLTAVGIAWLDPAGAPLAVLAAVLALGLPLLAQPLLKERDLRVRSHVGALGRFYLDALLGLVAVRTHAAERAVRREHQNLLAEWARAGIGLQRVVVGVEGVQSLLGFALVAWLLFGYLTRHDDGGGVLLLVYWALTLPVLGQEVALMARQYPAHRNVTLRLLEPLGAPEETHVQAPGLAEAPHPARSLTSTPQGVAIVLEGVSVRAAGHTILDTIDLSIEAGAHVAIVGPSGAGKSSLVGILLGWHRPATGRVLIDGSPLDGERLERLRLNTAWVDPTVQLWNRALLDNLRYGMAATASLPLDRVLDTADLRELLETLPDGLQTRLGEGGALVSGGEGQRVRLGRGLLRPGVRLVILDEPFRGLDRQRRRKLLARARCWWQAATVLCITHDVGETQGFERVLVVDGGQIVEDGVPADLAAKPGSRYRALLEAERQVREGLWSSGVWRRLRLEGGRLIEVGRNGGAG